MIKSGLFTIIAVLTAVGSTISQSVDYESISFHPPLKIAPVLAANFGELRSNHFHTGIDYKTNRRTGYNIYAIDDGYVSRIKVSPWGYGKAVYVDHYNGLTSVYAHCESFVGEIDDLRAHIQRTEEDFAINYYPPKDSLKVKRGQIIAHSGNTGGSTAPHLHFEIRETASEDALNPLLFNFDIKDTRKPEIRGLKVYALTDEGYRIPDKSKRFSVYGNDGTYRVRHSHITLPADFASKNGGVGFAVDAIDQLDAANNICGIHRAFLVVDGDTVYEQNMSRISFFTNSQINTHKDYEAYHRRGKYYQKTFKTTHNDLPIYRKLINNGILDAQPGKSCEIEYSCYDTHGNRSAMTFKLTIAQGEQPQQYALYSGEDKLYPDTPYSHIDSSHYLLFPPHLVYEPTPRILESKAGLLRFGSSAVPLDDYFQLMMKIDTTLGTRWYVKRTNANGYTSALNGKIHQGWIRVDSRNFGLFEPALDTLPPTIRTVNFSNGSTVGKRKLILRIDDEQSGISDYDVYIDGNWHLLSWEPKRRAFYFQPPQNITGEKSVRFRAVDHCGNKTTLDYTLHF
ncbi:MAG: M23 family metallopeptidase [Bacteroidota bacterium]